MNFLFEHINKSFDLNNPYDTSKYTNFTNCNDVNDSGVRRFGPSPLLQAANIYYGNEVKLKLLKPIINLLPIESDVDHYIISTSVNHSPDDWTGCNPKVKSLFYYLNDKYITDLRNKNALLLIDQSFEGYHTEWLWDWFHTECVSYNISPESIIYVTGNLIADEVYENWITENNIKNKMCVVGYPHFEIDVAMTTLNRLKNNNPLPNFSDHISYKKNNEIKTYCCLNKRIREHRVWFYYYLYESGLLPSGLVSMNRFDYQIWEWEGKKININDVGRILQDLPILVHNKPNDEFDDSFYIKRFNPEICLDTYISVISEAQCADADNTLFISEKTFKPIATHHPFIIMGNKFSIKKMKEMGYRTFDEYVDQTYDDLPTHDRLQSVIKSIKKIDNIKDKNEWFINLKSDIEHNYDNLISKVTKKPPEAFIKVLGYYNKFFNSKIKNV